MKKLARTISGVTPIAVMTHPLPCPGRCVYCPTYKGIPQSYTPESPAVLRARSCDFDPAGQIRIRLRVLEEMGHPTDKIELIVMGGTFPAYPPDYQYGFIKTCYDALNGTVSASLEEAQRRNETALRRCTGLCIETRPDCCGPEQVQRMLDFGATRVELGVQTLDDDIYRLIQRGHTVADVARATALLRQAAMKVYYHWMPGLPGATPETDLALSRKLFADERFRPDGLKLYPTMVVEGTELERWYREGRYQPYDFETMVDLVCAIKSGVPRYVRIPRVLRDIPSKYIVAGPRDSLRDVVRKRMQEKGTECQCTRCRECGHRASRGIPAGEPHLVRSDYDASGGREIFLSFEDDHGTLFGLLRLRVQDTAPPGLSLASGEKAALVRELHVFGQEVPLSGRNPLAAQHKGLGKALMQAAEKTAREEFHARQMVVLSGVGAREYYRAEFGYGRVGAYMVKEFE